jgi:hypothetical protein
MAIAKACGRAKGEIRSRRIIAALFRSLKMEPSGLSRIKAGG